MSAWMLATICCEFTALQDAGADQKKTQLPPVTERLGARPIIPKKEGKSGGNHGGEGARLPGSKAGGEEIAKLFADPMLKAHADKIAKWIADNQDSLKQAAQQSPLRKLAVEDPVAYNVLTYQLLLAVLERGDDRRFVTEMQAMRDDPAWKDWVSSYARTLLENLDEAKTPGETASDGAVKDVSYKDVLKHRLGDEDEDLLKSGGKLAGLQDEDVDLIRQLAGEARLSDEKEGDIAVDPVAESEGLAKRLEEKIKEYKKAIDQAIDQAKSGSGGGGDVKVEVTADDRIPPETLPTTNELWQLAGLPKTTRDFHSSALAREYARYAVRVAYERARQGLELMRGVGSGRARTAYEILLAHLSGQRTVLESVSDAATPAALHLRSALMAAAGRMETARRADQEARALAQHNHDASRAPRAPGDLQRAGVDDKGKERTNWRAGEHFEGANERVVETPLDQRADGRVGNITSQDDSVSSGGGAGIRLECRRENGKLKCKLVLPGGQSIPVTP